MEHSELSETGSINDIKNRLLLWAKRSPKGLARVEFSSEFSRQKVLDEMTATLAESKIKLHEIVLPSQQEAIVVVEKLLEQLNQIDSGLVSVTGFSTAFTNKVPLEESIRVLNFHRDRLVAPNLNQIWWMTPAFLQTSIHAMSDINSWFSLRLQLTEMILIDVDSEQHPSIIDPSIGIYTNIDDARRRVHNLLQRFQQGQLAGTPDLELLTTYLLPALKVLADVGAQKEFRDLTLQFENLLGQLKVTNSPELATSLDLLAGLYYSQGNYREAEPLYLRGLGIRECQFGVNHPSVATSASNLANIYRHQLRYSEAESFCLRALKIWDELNVDDLNVAATLDTLGLVYAFQGNSSKAELIFLRSLSLMIKHLGEDNPSVAVSLNRLATLYYSQGRYKESESFYLQALNFAEKRFGKDHPFVATSLNSLALLYEAQGQHSKAREFYLRTKNIIEQQLGKDHPSNVDILQNLALFYVKTGEFTEAEPLLIRVLDLQTTFLGEEHPDTIRTQESLMNVRAKMI